MNVVQLTQIARIARAIRFKEYLLGRDVSSRRIIIDHCVTMLSPNHPALPWFQNIRAINDQLDAKDRKEQIKSDAFWDDLIIHHSADPLVAAIMSWFLNPSL